MNIHRFAKAVAKMPLAISFLKSIFFNQLDFRKQLIIVCTLFATVINHSYSQCDLFCIQQVNVSLDVSCEATITPGMILNNSTTNCTGGDFSVILESTSGVISGSPNVNLTHAGQTFSAHVTDAISGNSCWGYITVEYKLPPQIDCPPDLTIPCGGLDVLTLPTATAQCGGGTFSVILLNEERTKLDCDPLYTQKITRTYRAEDSFGNSIDCTHDIYLERVDLSGIIFPDNALISCSDPSYAYDTNGFPLPWISGAVPTGSGSAGVPIVCVPLSAGIGFINPVCGSGSASVPFIPIGGATIANGTGHDLIPSEANVLCNSVIFYTDIEIPGTDCQRKIMRTWEIREWWCSGESSRVGTHLIEVKDDTPPTITCPPDFTASSDEDCEIMVQLPAATVSDACGNGTSVQIDTGNGLVQSNGGIGMLSTGTNVLTYLVNDNCYNSTSCTVNVQVSDNVEPVAICESHLVVALSSSTNTYLFASSLDDGSWDGCGIDRFEVRRMTSDCEPDDLVFGDKVALCCSDSNTEVMVVFRVYDMSGNFNDCMVIVDVQNKLTATLECPANMTVDCRDPYDPNNLEPAFGAPKVIGDCTLQNNVTEEVNSSVNQCGIGTIIRSFTLLGNDGIQVSLCEQTVTVVDNTPFTLSMINWPQNHTITSGVCSPGNVDPGDLMTPYGYPEFTGGNDQCSLLGYNYEDNVVYSTTPGQCFTIYRTWSVINWCDQSTGSFATFTNPLGPQVIEVTNPGSFTLDNPDPIVLSYSGADCVSGEITFERIGSTTCSPIRWNYYLYDMAGNYLGIADDTNVFSETLAAGDYTIQWIVQDACNNAVSQNQTLSVQSTKIPTPVCVTNLTAELDTPIDTDGDGINDQEILELWASDFDGGSYHTCNNPIQLSMTPNVTETNITFDCGDIGMNEIRLYVTDMVTGAQDYCTLFINITDGGICGDNLRVAVEGNIFTEELEDIEDVEVELEGGDAMEMTDNEGQYAFANMPLGGTYNVTPTKNDFYLNGVSTLDIIMIQRHILGVESFDSPYKLLAADVNNNERVSATDLIELRKLILGYYDELPDNSSWRFVDSEYQFIDEENPWQSQWPESYSISDLQSDMTIDFIGVKIGDVNSTALANVREKAIDTRSSSWPLIMTYVDRSVRKGETKTIKIYAENYESITGWQCTFEFDSDKIDILDIKGGKLDLGETNFNISKQDEGWLAMSYSNEEPLDIDNEEYLFEIEIEAKADLLISELFDMTSKVTSTEAYRGLNDVVNLEWRKTNAIEVGITGAKPNPFNTYTDLIIEAPSNGEGKLEFYDVDGRLVLTKKSFLLEGMNTVKVDRADLQISGVYYVHLSIGNVSTNYKLILID